MLKEMKWNMLLSAALYMVLGLIMLIFPATTAHTICYLLAGIAIVIGLVNLVVYFTRSITHNYYRNDFVTGLMLMILGFFVIYQVDLVISMVINPFDTALLLYCLLGAGLLFSGLTDLASTLYLSGKMHSYIRKMEDAEGAIKVTELRTEEDCRKETEEVLGESEQSEESEQGSEADSQPSRAE